MKTTYKYTCSLLVIFFITLASCDVNQVDERDKKNKLLSSLSNYEVALNTTIKDLKNAADWKKIIKSRKNSDKSIQNFRALNNKVRTNLTPLVAASENLLMNSRFKNSTVSQLNVQEKIMLAALVKAYNQQLKINPNYFNEKHSIKECINGNLLISNASNIKVSADITGREVWTCALSALGVNALVQGGLSSGLSSYGTRKALVKAVGAAAARAGLGVIGAAIVVGEFAWCLKGASED